MWMTKAQFLAYINCPTLFWFERRRERQPLSLAEELRIAEGRELGERARLLFPGGVLVSEREIRAAARRTYDLLTDPAVMVIFEATFVVGNFVTRADIMLRDGHRGWKLIEVKSSLHKDDHIEEALLHDLAYTTMVVQDSGIHLTGTDLMRISSDWRLGHDDQLLFQRVECSAPVYEFAGKFRELAQEVVAVHELSEPPEPRLTKLCQDCPFFASECLGKGVEHPIFEVPRLSPVQFNQLHALGVLDIREIPDGFRLTENQSRVVDCIKSGTMRIDRPGLERHLNGIDWPCYYLDFETAASALPFWTDMAPYEQILTQFSLHVAHGPDSEVEHCEYLSPHTEDSTHELLEALIDALGTQGSIVVYSSFEKTQLTKLISRYPERISAIKGILMRLFDLEKVFKDAVGHPLFRGKTSIKKTLPALVPEMTYDGLPIGNGEAAVAAFVKMAKGLCSEDEVSSIRKELLRYCHQDTLAMVKLHRAVMSLATLPVGERVQEGVVTENG